MGRNVIAVGVPQHAVQNVAMILNNPLRFARGARSERIEAIRSGRHVKTEIPSVLTRVKFVEQSVGSSRQPIAPLGNARHGRSPQRAASVSSTIWASREHG